MYGVRDEEENIKTTTSLPPSLPPSLPSCNLTSGNLWAMPKAETRAIWADGEWMNRNNSRPYS